MVGLAAINLTVLQLGKNSAGRFLCKDVFFQGFTFRLGKSSESKATSPARLLSDKQIKHKCTVQPPAVMVCNYENVQQGKDEKPSA